MGNTAPTVDLRRLAQLIVPTLCVGIHPVTLRVTIAQDLNLASSAGRRASEAAFPRRAWERSISEGQHESSVGAVELQRGCEEVLSGNKDVACSPPSQPRQSSTAPSVDLRRLAQLIVPTLCVGIHPVTLRVTPAQGLSLASSAGRRASEAAFPRRAWERSSRSDKILRRSCRALARLRRGPVRQ